MSVQNFPLQERTVILTGGTTQIGASIANALADQGASVAFLDKNLEKAQRIADHLNDQREIKAGRGRRVAIQADLAKPHHAKEAVSKVAEYFGGVDIYVDALTIARSFSFESEGFSEELERFVDVNLKAPLYLTFEVLKFMKGRKRGRIIYFVQDISRIGYAGETLGAVSRTGLVGFARSLARDVAAYNITVNCLAIGPTEEYLLMRDPQASSIHQAQQELIKSIPQAKMTLPEDISGVVSFIASPASGAITGQTIVASGGLTMTT
jgi:3-oxoacyl-[acyl-carrier protein] reductase